MVLYILFHWSGTPVRSQLVFCMQFCIWRCIPDVSMERGCTSHPPTPLPSCSLLIISSLRQTFLTCLMLCLVLCWSFCNRLFLMHVASPWIFWRTLKLILKLPFVSYYDLVWRRKWQPTPVSLPGKFHGWRSLVGYIPLGCKESESRTQLSDFIVYKLYDLVILFAMR